MLGGGVSHPLQLTTRLVIKSVTTSPTLAGEHILFILQVSILSEQTGVTREGGQQPRPPRLVTRGERERKIGRQSKEGNTKREAQE